MSKNISMVPCPLATQKWSFSTSTPSSIPDGEYSVKYVPRAPSGQDAGYLKYDPVTKNMVVTKNTVENASYGIFSVRTYGGQHSIILESVLVDNPSIDGKSAKLYGSITASEPSGDLSFIPAVGPTTVLFAVEKSVGDTNLFSIYMPGNGSYYVPQFGDAVPEGGAPNPVKQLSLVSWAHQEDAYGWQFTPVNCSRTEAVPSGQYIIKYEEKYLRINPASGGELQLTMQSPTQNNFASYMWSYNKDTGQLSNCVGPNQYMSINYDPLSVSTNIGQLVGVSPSSFTPVNMAKTSSGMVIELNATSKSFLNVVSTFLDPSTTYVPIALGCNTATSHDWILTNYDVTRPESIPTGRYLLRMGDLCIDSTGALASCSSNPFWDYSAETSTLRDSVSGKCLINPSTSMCDMKALTVGDCASEGANRFILGKDGQLFDPGLNLCYTQSSEGYAFTTSVSYSSEPDNSSLVWIVPLVLFILVIFGIAWAKYKRKI